MTSVTRLAIGSLLSPAERGNHGKASVYYVALHTPSGQPRPFAFCSAAFRVASPRLEGTRPQAPSLALRRPLDGFRVRRAAGRQGAVEEPSKRDGRREPRFGEPNEGSRAVPVGVLLRSGERHRPREAARTRGRAVAPPNPKRPPTGREKPRAASSDRKATAAGRRRPREEVGKAGATATRRANRPRGRYTIRIHRMNPL